MKKILFILPMIAILLATSCSEDFLDRKNIYEQSDESFYRTPTDIDQALSGAYACLTSPPSNDRGDLIPLYIANARADYSFGGGDPNDLTMHDLAAFTNTRGNNAFAPTWQQAYRGVFRTNMIISKFDQAEYTNQTQRNQDLGEAHFLRALFYFRLGQIFGSVPVFTEPQANPVQAPAEVLYGQIASDLKMAIELMPSVSYDQISSARLGHATKWAAQSLMARVFLFYTGYYNASDLPLTEGGSITKAQVITWLDDVINNSGHALISDFRNLWAYSYNDGSGDYSYVEKEGLSWVGEEGANIEAIFSVRYSSIGGTNHGLQNKVVLYSSIRVGYNGLPWGEGWGGCTVNPQLWENWNDNDPRKRGTIIDVFDEDEGISHVFSWGSSRINAMHETGYFQKKYHSVLATDSEDDRVKSIYAILYNQALTQMQAHNSHDEQMIRFADVLLMAAELKEDASYLNQVRNRAGLPDVAYSLEAVKQERLYEFAYEGLRYYDLLRWGDAVAAFAKVKDVPVYNEGSDTPEPYTINFSPERAFLPIPDQEINISGGLLKQHPGWVTLD